MCGVEERQQASDGRSQKVPARRHLLRGGVSSSRIRTPGSHQRPTLKWVALAIGALLDLKSRGSTNSVSFRDYLGGGGVPRTVLGRDGDKIHEQNRQKFLL